MNWTEPDIGTVVHVHYLYRTQVDVSRYTDPEPVYIPGAVEGKASKVFQRINDGTWCRLGEYTRLPWSVVVAHAERVEVADWQPLEVLRQPPA